MNIYKFLKPVVPAVMLVSTGIFIASCSSSDDSPAVEPPVLAQCEDGIDNDNDGLTDFPADPGCINALDNDENDPPIPTDGITGIWEGTFSRNTTLEQIEYKVTMMFHMPDVPKVEGRGNSGGVALGDGPTKFDENPHFLFEGGYEYSAEPVKAINPLNGETLISCNADVYALGRSGTQGTFVQEFSYELGSAAGPDQRGAGCLYLEDNKLKLTGEINFEEAGKLQVALTYSHENARTSSLSDLDTVGSDDTKYHLWSNDNSGTSMAYSKLFTLYDIMRIRVVENRATGECGGDVIIAKVADHNLFTVETVEPHAAGCNVSLEPEFPKVETQHFGLGAVIEVDGKLQFVHLMASQTGDAPNAAAATAFYNNFTLQ